MWVGSVSNNLLLYSPYSHIHTLLQIFMTLLILEYYALLHLPQIDIMQTPQMVAMGGGI